MGEASWIEVSLIVDGEMAEAVAEVLRRFVSGGVVIESTQIEANAEDEGRAVGPLRVCGYLPVDEELDSKRERLEEALWFLGRIRELPEVQFRTIQEEEWAEAWKENFQPIRLGRRLLVLPAWMQVEDGERIPMLIDPGMAFGTGTHPSTQLCLELVDELLSDRLMGREIEGIDVIDIGCGSGILAVAALKLGASRALGVDTDAEALRATLHNASANGVEERLEVGLGSVAEIRAGIFSLHCAPLVLANILAPTLVRLFQDGLAELVTERGFLVLSGILLEQSGDVEAAAQAHGLSLAERRQVGDWVALVFQ